MHDLRQYSSKHRWRHILFDKQPDHHGLHNHQQHCKRGDGGGIWCYYQSLPLISGTILCGNSPDQILGSWSDGGANTIADECPVDCDGDITGDGNVDVNDLLTVIAEWGVPYDVNDVLTVIEHWGPCP